VVHCHNLTQNPILLLAAKMAGVKIRISHSHLTTAFSRKTEILMPVIRFWINTLATHRLACGNDAGRFLYGKKKFLVINNAIDIDKFLCANPLNLQKELGLSKNVKILLHVGRLSGQKNHIYLISIMEKLSKAKKDIVLLCCGSGPDMDKIKRKVSEKGLDNILLLLGSRTDIPQLMKSANLLLLPSLYEGFPVTLVESQASGLYSLVSDTVDKESDLGINLVEFLPIDDVDVWVDEICRLLDKTNENFQSVDIKKELETHGYSSVKNSRVLEKIYMEATK
jgi:glycosyltransferase EpsF